MGRAAPRGGAGKAAPEAVDQGAATGAGRVSATAKKPIVAPDPGPLARFAEVTENPSTMPILAQRLSEGETLKEIAKDWEIPYGRLAQWVIEDRERSEQYNVALKIWADSLAQECVSISDEQNMVTTERGTTFDPDVPRDKLRIETRLKLAGKWDRNRYGEQTKHEHTGSLSLISVLSSIPRGEVFENEVPAPALPRQVATEGVI